MESMETAPSIRTSLRRVSSLTASLVGDRLKLVELDLQDLASNALRGALWLTLASTAVLLAWGMLLALLVAALDQRLPLLESIAVVAAIQLVVTGLLVTTSIRRVGSVEADLHRVTSDLTEHPAKAPEPGE